MSAQDLLSILGGAQPRAAAPHAATTAGGAETSILSFKAGKMTTTLKPNGKYRVEPDLRRGELHVVWASAPPAPAAAAAASASTGSPGGHLKLEWRDRRTRTAVDSVSIFGGDDATFERVGTGRDDDRVYLLQSGGRPESRHFFWMQDKDPEPDEELCVKVNLYLADPPEAASAAAAASSSAGNATPAAPTNDPASGAMDQAELLRLMQGALGASGEGSATTTVPGSEHIPTGQIDALGTMLEGLGAPSPEEGGGAGTAAGGAAGGLTLADLQGAMAGLNTAASSGESAGEEEEGKEEEPEEETKEEETKEETKEEGEAKDEEPETGEEPTAETRLIVLVSNGVYDVVQAANQREALRLLDDLGISYDQIDGMDPNLREKRNALFEASGIRGNYPQIFSTTGTDEEAKYLGGYEWLNDHGVEELKAIVPAGAAASDASKKAAGRDTSQTAEGKRPLTVLISEGVYDMVQASNQRDALRLLDDLAIPYETIDGMDPELRERRNALFEISGVRGNYPQIFIAGGDDDGDAPTFLGGYEWLSQSSPDELNELVKK